MMENKAPVFLSPRSLVGHWTMEYFHDADAYNVEYSFGADGSGVERVTCNGALMDNHVFVFNWNDQNGSLSLFYKNEPESRIIMNLKLADRICIFNDPVSSSVSMILERVD